jgi:putative MATE family efflux protein
VSSTARFTTGSTMRHVVVMTGTASVGLIAIFLVDALNLFYISLLGVQELAAAIGFAGTLMFFTLSCSIGLMIATSALVARALGRGDREDAARVGGAAMIFTGISMTASSLAIWPFLSELTALLGARGETLELATGFLKIVIPSTPIMALGMCASGILRGLGDARRAMYVTLGSGLAAAVFDPILIFGLDLGLDGAAIATFFSRVVMLIAGVHGAQIVHRLMKLPDWERLKAAARPFFAIGLPAVMTQIATPVGNAYVTAEIARFGDDAVAGWAIIGRVVPVAFGAIFALSGAVGPILGQNYGAGLYDRLNSTMRDSLTFIIVYVLGVWALLALFSTSIADLFAATGLARELVIFFCLFAAGSFLFNGALFTANAAFNNLGFPTYSAVFNWGRSTLGVIPFVWAGASLSGATGVIAGWALGAVVFGVAAMWVCFRVVRRIGQQPPTQERRPGPPPAAQSPFSTGKAATAG